ncbi:MAG: helix-turn-helix domain-containing protein, partial [Cupriavidus sp.]|nr:helix-turn-helix domain-containing protein [Cupriavidus sp.]
RKIAEALGVSRQTVARLLK